MSTTIIRCCKGNEIHGLINLQKLQAYSKDFNIIKSMHEDKVSKYSCEAYRTLLLFVL